MGVRVVLLSLALCAPAVPCAQPPPEPARDVSELWVEPEDLESLDLFYGPGGKAHAPRSDVVYRFRNEDTTGHSHGYDVVDPEGRKWDVKIGDEANTEVAVSRILWAIGYHQPVVHYVSDWKMSGAPAGKETAPGRFRLESDHKVVGRWSWVHDCPFAGTQAYRGLLVANLVLNNWDLQSSQNRIFEMKGDVEGPKRRYVVLDVGGSLGRTHLPVGSRNDIEGFESQDLVHRVEDGRILFDYHARHRPLFRQLTAEDVVWTCRLMARLSDAQLHDAFRAAGYPEDIADRFIRKIRTKIEEGLALDQGGGAK